MRRVADWQIAHYNKAIYGDLNWVNATFYLGLAHWAAVAEQTDQDDSYYKWLLRLGNRNYWQVDQRMYHADDICISQAYLYLYEKYKRKGMLIPTLARAEWVATHPSSGSFRLDYSDGSTLERWTWCDALFMAPPVYMKLYNITGDKKFIRFMDKEYKATYDYLFDKDENLFYRDHRYFTMKEANGAKVFWGRGNGWVLGARRDLARTSCQE
ncbi:rhamnogalacturonides degradation protein RhiN [Bacteroides reticulotermitis JCM 10512]|uniref:Rhamnogalacturonides degradation protein RhiN n=1 Tax=Bacteroides reticulotermitis JCM 10512 TaxID=1445607 RepID=W4UPZ7_9BACE|nr:rhamnogalacturonides degradation protein RhiN [Bacteroides reticulotermitis JCM 10512]